MEHTGGGKRALARAAMPSSRSLSISLCAACTAASCSSRHFSAAVSLPWAAESAATTACELFPIMSRTAHPSCVSWLLNRRYCNLTLASVGRGACLPRFVTLTCSARGLEFRELPLQLSVLHSQWNDRRSTRGTASVKSPAQARLTGLVSMEEAGAARACVSNACRSAISSLIAVRCSAASAHAAS